MSRRRVPLGVVVPIALVALVGALAYLQYQWVGQVSEAQRTQLREWLDHRALQFADDFDREISRAYQAFRLDRDFDPSSPDRFARQDDEWRSATRFPGLVKTVYFADAADAGVRLLRYSREHRSFSDADWPVSLAPVRAHLERLTRKPSTDAAPATLSLNMGPVLADLPAVLIPDTPPIPPPTAAHMTTSGTTSVVVAVSRANRHVILELDRDYIVTTMVPALFDQHFPETGSDRYRAAVMKGAEVVLARGLPEGGAIDPANADARATFFGNRIELVTPLPASSGEGFGTAQVTRQTQRFAVIVEQRSSGQAAWSGTVASGWTILLQHSAGSLDLAVAEVRRHNLQLSFGILAVLLAGVGLLIVNARRSERLAAQQMDFVSTVSHELRTPVAVIRSAAQNLSAGVVQDPGQARQYGDLIEKEGRRLTDMVEQVLEYAGLSGNRRPPDARPVDAGELIHEVVSSCAALPEAGGVQFAVQVPPDLPPLQVEAHGARRALHNLVVNALKYAADGEWIGVTAARGAGRDAGQVLITVADRGRGIPAEDLPHVFDAFYRGRYARERQIHGNGLGLSLVKRIAEAHGGRVIVTSAPGQGAAFTLYLPAAAHAVGAHAASAVTEGRTA